MSASMTGEKHYMFGKKRSAEICKKISDSNRGYRNHQFGKRGSKHHSSKTYKITRPDGSIDIITGLKNYCDINILNTGNMSSVASGKKEHHKGFKCEHYIQTTI